MIKQEHINQIKHIIYLYKTFNNKLNELENEIKIYQELLGNIQSYNNYDMDTYIKFYYEVHKLMDKEKDIIKSIDINKKNEIKLFKKLNKKYNMNKEEILEIILEKLNII